MSQMLLCFGVVFYCIMLFLLLGSGLRSGFKVMVRVSVRLLVLAHGATKLIRFRLSACTSLVNREITIIYRTVWQITSANG